MIIFSADSTSMSSTITSFVGTMMMNPEVGFGVVGTKQRRSSPSACWTSPSSSSSVWKYRL